MKRHFHSFEHFRSEVQRPGQSFTYCTSLNATEEWTGTKSFDHALQLMDNGWPEGLARIQELKREIKAPSAMSETFAFHHSESGDEPDIGRFVDCEPECMMEFHTEYVPRSGRVVRLMLNAFVSAGISRESIFLRGAAAMALSDAIEQTGLRCEIDLIMAAKSNSCSLLTDVVIPIKAADQQIEPDRLAFMLAHPSIFRRFMGRLFEQEPNREFQKHWSGWGQPGDLNPVPEDAVYFGSLDWDSLRNPQDCIEFVKRTLARYTESVPA